MKIELETRFKDIVNRIPKPKEKIEVKNISSNPFIFKSGASIEEKRDWAINLRKVIYNSYKKIIKENKGLEELFNVTPPTNNEQMVFAHQMGLMGAAGTVEKIERAIPKRSKQLFGKILEMLIDDKTERDTLKVAIKKFGEDNKNIEAEQKLFNAFCTPHINTVKSMIDNVENQSDVNFPKAEAYEIIKRSLDNLELLTQNSFKSISDETHDLIKWLTDEQIPKLDKAKALSLGKWFLDNKKHVISLFNLYEMHPEFKDPDPSSSLIEALPLPPSQDSSSPPPSTPDLL